MQKVFWNRTFLAIMATLHWPTSLFGRRGYLQGLCMHTLKGQRRSVHRRPDALRYTIIFYVLAKRYSFSAADCLFINCRQSPTGGVLSLKVSTNMISSTHSYHAPVEVPCNVLVEVFKMMGGNGYAQISWRQPLAQFSLSVATVISNSSWSFMWMLHCWNLYWIVQIYNLQVTLALRMPC